MCHFRMTSAVYTLECSVPPFLVYETLRQPACAADHLDPLHTSRTSGGSGGRNSNDRSAGADSRGSLQGAARSEGNSQWRTNLSHSTLSDALQQRVAIE